MATKVNNRREAALIALLSATSIKQAAAVAGVSERQLHRWLLEEKFSDQLRQARRTATNQAMQALQVRMSEAVSTLSDVMTDRKAGGMARVTAARATLEFGFRSVEASEILGRIEKLEQQQEDDR